MEKKTRAATESGVLLLVVFGILIALNALSALGFYKRFDRTQNEKFSLSKGSGNLLRGMKQNMHIDAYVTKGLPKLDSFVRDLRDLLQEYKDASGGKFDYTMIEAKDEETKKAAKEAGLAEQPFGEASDTEDKAAVTMGFMGLVLKYGSEKDAIKSLQPERTDGLEFWITNKIRELRDKGDGVKHKIGVVSGKDEIKLTDTNLVPANMGKFSIQQIVTQNFPFYTFQDVDLKNGDATVDADIDGLIITQPGKDYSEKELRAIDAFVMSGKSLVVIASAVNVKPSDATMNATLSTHGLEKLLDGYGIELRKDAVLDFGRSMRVYVQTQSGAVPARFPQIIKVTEDRRFTGDEQLLDTAFPAFFRMQEIAIPLASSVVVHPEKQPDAKLSVVARTTPRGTRLTGDTADLKFLQNWASTLKKGEWAQYGLAAAVDGTMKSAFDASQKSAKPARVFVLASAQFLANPFARAGNGTEMGGQFGMQMPMGGDEILQSMAGPYAQQELTTGILSFKNTLDWLTGDTDLLAVSAKILSEPALVYGDVSKPNFDPNETEDSLKKKDDEMKLSRKSTQLRVQWFLTLGVPLLFILFGVIRWQMRMKARENISLA